jgi:hypothetical protein
MYLSAGSASLRSMIILDGGRSSAVYAGLEVLIFEEQ